jgi:hypothetical protein
VAYAYLDGPAYGLFPGFPKTLPSLIPGRQATRLSMCLDNNGRAVLTWLDAIYGDYLFYALFDEEGNNDTPPMIFLFNASVDLYLDTSAYGFGNAAYLGVFQVLLPLVRR